MSLTMLNALSLFIFFSFVAGNKFSTSDGSFTYNNDNVFSY